LLRWLDWQCISWRGLLQIPLNASAWHAMNYQGMASAAARCYSSLNMLIEQDGETG